MRVSYARTLETPFNENLVLSSTGCGNPVLNPLLACSVSVSLTPFSPGWRNEFHAGIQQAFGKYLVFSGEYIWKYTHNAYDFSVLGAHSHHVSRSSGIIPRFPDYAGRVSVPNYHGFSALVVLSSVAARFFPPQIGGAGAAPSARSRRSFSASIMTRSSTRRPTSSTSRGRRAHGSASIGDMTAAWWPGKRHALRPPQLLQHDPCSQTEDGGGYSAPSDPDEQYHSGLPLTADQEFEAGLTCNGNCAAPTPLGTSAVPCIAVRLDAS